MASSQLGIITKRHFAQARSRATSSFRSSPALPVARSSPHNLQAAIGSYHRDPELQAALDDLFADTIKKGRKRVPLADIQHHVDRISEVARRLGLNKIDPQWNDGSFQELITTNLMGVDEAGVSTLQRLTFGTVRPGELQVNVNAEAEAGAADKPNQIKGPLSQLGAEGYALNVYFKILTNGALGKLIIKAEYDTKDEDTSKLGVTFGAFKVEPLSTDEKSLTLWKEALAEHNPNMDAAGAIEITFPKKPRAFLKYILMEPEYQLTIGGSGDFLTTKRIA